MDENTTQTYSQQSAQPQAPQVPGRNWFKLLLFILLGVLVLLAVGGGSYYLGTRMVSKPSHVSTSSTLVASKWPTYANSQYGFSFQYPSNLTTSSGGNGKQFSAVFVSSDNKEQLFVWAADTMENLNTARGLEGSTVVLKQPVVVGGQSGTLQLLQNKQTAFNTYILTFTDEPLEMELSGPQNSVSLDVFNRILSTLSFTKKPTANWQTLHNTNGFSISYPSSFTAHGVGMVDDPIHNTEVMVGDTIQRNNAPFIEISVFEKQYSGKGSQSLYESTMADYNAIVNNKNVYVATIQSPTQTTVDRIPAYTYVLNSKGSGGSDGGWYEQNAKIWHTVEVQANGRIYRFIYQENSTLQQIINTLNFQ